MTSTTSQSVPFGGTVNLYPNFARCPAGKRLIGGGTYNNGGTIITSGPYVEGSTVYDIWQSGVLYHNESGGPVTLTVTAVAYCATIE